MSDKPLRVLHVLGELKPSGAETMLVAAAPLFRAHGVDAEVLSTGVHIGPYAKRFEAVGYRVHHLPFTRSPGFFRKERQLMRAGRYDAIHLHCEGANFWHGIAAWSARPHVLLRTIHNVFAFTGNLQWRRGVQRRLLQWLGVRHVSISSSVQDTELRHYQLPTTLVWNWYDSQRFTATAVEARAAARAGFGLQKGDFVIASVGNCSRIKNHAAVIQAMAMLPAELRPIYLHAGIEDEIQSERELARQFGMEDRIRFLGVLQDVLPLLQAADAFVMPSLYEGFGIAAIEALATGLPALFADVAGLCDFRKDFPYLVYTGTSAQQVSAGLKALIQMPMTQKIVIQQQYPATARRLFGMERGVQEYLAIYQGTTPPQRGHGDILNARREAGA
jgi:glycosyltransferase involved in cell wall biosynthesis